MTKLHATISSRFRTVQANFGSMLLRIGEHLSGCNAFLTIIILSRCSTLHSISSAIDRFVLFLCCLSSSSMTCRSCSLHLTTFCLQYKPTVIACVCIHLACKWSNWEIPVSTDGKHWWEYVDSSVTLELLDGKWRFH